MGMKVWGICWILLLSTFTSAQVFISEVMYDFPSTDTKHEWIELYNSGNSINLSSWKLKEGGTNHGLTLVNGSWIMGDNQSIIIADDAPTFLIDYPNFNSTLFDSTFTSGLSNYGEELVILDSSSKGIDNLTYNVSLGAAGNGMTLCLYNHSWQECLATPGRINEINLSLPTNNTNSTNTTLPNLRIIPYLTSPIYTHTTYNNLYKLIIENKDNCSQKDQALVEYNISGSDFYSSGLFEKEIGCSSYASTGSFSPSLPGNYTLCALILNTTVNESISSDNQICFPVNVIDLTHVDCDLTLNLNFDENTIYQQGESISYAFTLNNNSFPFTIEYWIEDLFGRTVKSRYNTTNTYSKTWKTDISEEDRVLILKGKLYSLCKDNDLNNNLVEKRFIVTNQNIQVINGTNLTNSSGSNLNISKVTPIDPEWGEIIKVDLQVYKGNTAKYALNAWVERGGHQVSEVTKFNLKDKNTLYGLTLPIQLDQDCSEDDEDVTLVVEGLDQHEEFDLTIQGSSSCEEGSSSSASSSKSSSEETTPVTNEDIRYELVGVPPRINPGEVLNFKIKIKNDEWDHFFQMYSYVYRGSRCYSCTQETIEKEDNLQEMMLGYDQEGEVQFSLPLDSDMKEGIYKLKVRVHKDGQITGESVDTNITVGEVKEENKQEGTLNLASNHEENAPLISSQRVILNQSKFLVYESSDEKAKKWIPYLLILVLGLLCVILIRKR
jgi:hypothetical protein